MKYRLLTQSAVPESGETLEEVLSEVVRSLGCDRVYAATAYATVGGVRKLLTVMAEGPGGFESRWLFGLDDYVTQPGAIELCSSLPASSLRVAAFSKRYGSKFHPKVFLLSSSQNPPRSALVVGSSNLTAGGLSRNAEAATVLYSESEPESAELHAFWQDYWDGGSNLTGDAFRTYREGYRKVKTDRERTGQMSPVVEPEGEPGAKKQAVKRRAPSKRVRAAGVLERDEAEIDPSVASVCWIEVGSITGKGVELELTAEQALFFHLSPPSEYREFALSDGTRAGLKLKYQENGMWRLQMNRVVPEVAVGLRPRSITGKLMRSPYVAVFRRMTGATFDLRFIDEGGEEYSDLVEESRRSGTLGSTTARRYGWF